MTREEFANALGINVADTPKVPAYPDVTWQMMYDNACPVCKTFTLRATFPVLHHAGCPNQERGFQEGLERIFARCKEAENATQDDYEERA